MTHTRSTPARRAAPALMSLTLAGALALTGCGAGEDGGSGSSSSSGGGTSCTLTGCTVTLQRGVDAKASVLGVNVELVGVTGDAATVRVGNQQVTLPLDGQAATNVAGFDVAVQSANDTQIVLKITKS